MNTRRGRFLAGPLALLLAGLASPVLAQTVTASVTGTVTDNTGAILQGRGGRRR